MCHHGRRFESGGHDQSDCSCVCPATMTVEEEIQLIEDHRKYFSEQAGVIDKKIAALKSAQGS